MLEMLETVVYKAVCSRTQTSDDGPIRLEHMSHILLKKYIFYLLRVLLDGFYDLIIQKIKVRTESRATFRC
jgi:hypothetical protein